MGSLTDLDGFPTGKVVRIITIEDAVGECRPEGMGCSHLRVHYDRTEKCAHCVDCGSEVPLPELIESMIDGALVRSSSDEPLPNCPCQPLLNLMKKEGG